MKFEINVPENVSKVSVNIGGKNTDIYNDAAPVQLPNNHKKLNLDRLDYIGKLVKFNFAGSPMYGITLGYTDTRYAEIITLDAIAKFPMVTTDNVSLIEELRGPLFVDNLQNKLVKKLATVCDDVTHFVTVPQYKDIFGDPTDPLFPTPMATRDLQKTRFIRTGDYISYWLEDFENFDEHRYKAVTYDGRESSCDETIHMGVRVKFGLMCNIYDEGLVVQDKSEIKKALHIK
jgi:hypothetical protein